VLKKENENYLSRFEIKIIKKIYGPIKQEEQWRIRNNEEIDEILKKENIVRDKKNRLDANRRPRKYLYENIYTKRVKCRPKLRWFDDVREDLRILKVKD
jgi:hypothetical protein